MKKKSRIKGILSSDYQIAVAGFVCIGALIFYHYDYIGASLAGLVYGVASIIAYISTGGFSK